MSDYVYTTELKNLPYNIESLLNAASYAFNFVFDMEFHGDLPTFVTTTEKNFYKMTERLSDEIIKRARIDAGIIIVDERTKAHMTEECDKNSSPVGDSKVIIGNEYDVLKDDGKTDEKEQTRPKYRRTYGSEREDVDTSSDAELE